MDFNGINRIGYTTSVFKADNALRKTDTADRLTAAGYGGVVLNPLPEIQPMFYISRLREGMDCHDDLETAFQKFTENYDTLAKEIEDKFGKGTEDYYQHMEGLNADFERELNQAALAQVFTGKETTADSGGDYVYYNGAYYPRYSILQDQFFNNARRIASSLYEEFINRYKNDGYDKAYADSLARVKSDPTTGIGHLSLDDYQRLAREGRTAIPNKLI